jgi:hypothetical protein
VSEKVPADDIGRLWIPGTCLDIYFPYSKDFGGPFAQAVEDAIPQSIRGACCMVPEAFKTGLHRWSTLDARGKVIFTADATFVFGFHPAERLRDPWAMAEMILRVPVMNDLKRKLETVVGPLNEFAYWPGT